VYYEILPLVAERELAESMPLNSSVPTAARVVGSMK